MARADRRPGRRAEACAGRGEGPKARPMTKAPFAAYPALRLRRLRQADWIRRLVRESVVTPNDLIWAMVVHDGEADRAPVAAMPGTDRLSIREAARAAVQARALGIPAIAIFPHIDGAKKDIA